ncbi:MAG: S-4TM family putative pore-forming effector, partial [Parcubacteria group bacterium]
KRQKFQELFDTQVLDLNWNEVVVGSKPDHEIIGSIVQKIKPDSTLKNWYPVDDSSIDISFARFLCQRSNAWWDSTLRKMYIRFLYCVLFLIVVGIVFIGIKFKLSLGDLILGIIMPVLSLIQLIIKQVNDNISSFKRMTKLKEDIDIVIEKFLGGENVENPKELSRCFQDEIFRHRKSSPQVFDWVYWFLKNNQENQMQYSINAKMEEFKTKK